MVKTIPILGSKIRPPAMLVLAAVAFGSISGCASHTYLASDYKTPEPLPHSYASQFCYQASPVAGTLSLLKEKRSYRIYEGSIEAGLEGFDDDSPITFEFYEQVGDARAPVAVVLPILNGKKHLVRPFATHFAKHGYAVVIVNNLQRRTLLQDLADPEPAIRQAIQRHRRVIDWVESRSDLDASKIAVFGPSLGGFNALFVASLDERVKAVVPALAGGPLSGVLIDSDERRIKEAVDEAKTELSMDDEQLMQHLVDNIQSDPLMLAPHVNANRVLMILAKYDKAVPYESQVRLWQAMGEPEAISLPTGHVTAAAYLFYLRSQVRKFFDRKLAEPDEYGTAVIADGVCS